MNPEILRLAPLAQDFACRLPLALTPAKRLKLSKITSPKRSRLENPPRSLTERIPIEIWAGFRLGRPRAQVHSRVQAGGDRFAPPFPGEGDFSSGPARAAPGVWDCRPAGLVSKKPTAMMGAAMCGRGRPGLDLQSEAKPPSGIEQISLPYKSSMTNRAR
jgi:hypothetical protein